MSDFIQIGRRKVGRDYPVFIIAEMSANHSQDFKQAVKLVRAAKEAGADAVKLQTYTPDTLTLRSDKPCFRIKGGTLWDGKTLFDLYGEAAMPWKWQPKLKKVAEDCGLILFSTAFDPTSVDFLERMDVPAHKIASFELVDLPLIEKVARTGKPLILSTGMASLEEIREAVRTARRAGARQIALLKCTSAYPAPPEEMNLAAIPYLEKTFGLPVGLSDHTMGETCAVAAVALGASIVEKHMTLSRKAKSPDSAFSMEPHEFRRMADAIRAAQKAVGEARYRPPERESGSRNFRRSLFVVKPVKKGEALGAENVRSIRPAGGLPPKYFANIEGRAAARDLPAGTPLAWGHISGSARSRRPSGRRAR